MRNSSLSRQCIAAGLLALGLTVGCNAQSAPSSVSDPTRDGRIGVIIRNQYNLPVDVEISIGARKPSEVLGYDKLPITLSLNGKIQVLNVLISTDGTKLAQMSTFDLTKDPAYDVPITGRPVRGNPNAKVTVVNFDDLECPYCARMHHELFPTTFDRYKNLVRFVYEDFPLIENHPWAMHAAVDANCLAGQSGEVYWTYVDYLHTHGNEVDGENRDIVKSFATLDRIARNMATLGKLDETQLNACVAKQDETLVLASIKRANDLGLEGTPAVIVNGERVNGGAVPEDQLWIVIDRALRAAGETPPAPPPPVPVPANQAPAARLQAAPGNASQGSN